MLSGLATGLKTLVGTRVDRRGTAQYAGTPAATSVTAFGATRGLLDVHSGTPPATDDASA